MLFSQTGVTYAVGILLTMSGVVIMWIAGSHYDLKSFSGVTEEKADVLRTDKLNRFVRHPLYSGTSLFLVGICITWPYIKNVSFLVIYFVYLAIGMYLEEKKLVQVYGEGYRNYQKKVKKLVPYIW